VGSGAGRSVEVFSVFAGTAGTGTCSAGTEAGVDSVWEDVSDMVYESRKSVIPALMQYNLDDSALVCQ